VSIHLLNCPDLGEEDMTSTNLEKRDQLAYLALYYAIHGEDERSEKIRLALRQLDSMISGHQVAEPVGA
jgi:hypothetical protein